jgi:peptidyl-prolyl cis-trans isomerase A (cyclophilin A)
MRRLAVVGTLMLVLTLAACKPSASTAPVPPSKAAPAAAAGPAASAAPGGPWTSKVAAGQELFASIETSMGTVVVKLYSKEAPLTVSNFVGLATGEKEWRNPATGQSSKAPLYAGTVFHRVIDGFMIQGGDPLGSGAGDPGYRFQDEPNGKTFDRTGLLAMANAGPNTNGSQFFITVSTPTYLNGRHTIFGEVVKGYEVVTAISKAPRGAGDRPLQKVEIVSITLSES